MKMSSRSIFERFQSKQGLPVSSPDPVGDGIRRRLSLKIRELQASPGLQRSKSMGAELSMREWWGWGWEWILSKKPAFAQDLEMNDQEMAAIGSQSKGTFRHLFFKLKLHLGSLLRGSSHNMVLPQSIPSSS